MVTVLVVDDEPAILELVRVTLEDERVRVIAVPDGETALEQAAVTPPDLIFLDVHLPGLSGFEVCRQLRADRALADVKIVMLTAATRPEDEAQGLAAGADHYLTKPFSPVRLLSLVETLVPRAEVWARP